MAKVHIPDVQDIYFQHKTLTCIAGEPNFGSLQVLAE